MSVKYLLKKFPELMHSQAESKWTPLMIACEAGHVELIELIVGKMPKLLYDYSCETGTPLHAAITGQKPLETVKALLE